ncbi:hypothetical protein ASC90_14150 [Rhizobium sp. Root1220]|nr:hypothetical protein ASC90_14150 [Rhizobium sp. Root1220]
MPEKQSTIDFLASHGGPFYELQRRMNLLQERALRTGRRALLFVGIAWFVPLLLTIPSLFSAAPTVTTYLSDPGAWAKFMIAIGAFVLAEQQVERGLRHKLRQFMRAPLIAPAATKDAIIAVNRALRQRDSRTAEIACLALAVFASVIAYANWEHVATSSWTVTVTPDGNQVTLAGWWTIFVSLPLFVFLFFRGVWRHLVWALLLRRIAKLELRLVATHPDGKGGLSFLAEYPNAYMFFVFGISAAIAAAFAKHLMQETLSTGTFTTMMGAWLVVVLAFFAHPLSAFSKPLAMLKEQSLLVLAAKATTFQRAAERKAIGANVAANSAEEAAEPVEIVDLGKQYDTTRKLSAMLINRSAVLPVAAAALLPFAVVGATRLPYKEVFSVLKKLLLL